MTVFLTYALALLVGYGFGAFPTAWLAGKLYGVNILAGGSGNMGATNVGRLIGGRPAILVAAVDLGKGALAVWLCQRLLPAMPLAAILSGMAALLGHVYSVPLKFLAGRLRGGRGVATAFGAACLLLPWPPLLLAVAVLLAGLALTRVVTLSTLAAAGSAFLLVLVLYWLDALSLAQLTYAAWALVVLGATHLGKLIPVKPRPR
jgi:glycerol-3-phosphate acyltransferase PlsY